MKNKFIAHRGFKNKYPENSLGAIADAIALNVGGIEIDIRASLDGELFVTHDNNTLRVAEESLIISRSTINEIADITLGKNQHIPTLDEVFKVISEQNYLGLLNIEIKADHFPDILLIKLAEKIVESKINTTILISSFNHLLLQKLNDLLKKNGVEVFGLAPLVACNMLDLPNYLKKNNFRCVVIEYSMLLENIFLLDQLKAYNISIFVYTPNNKRELMKLMKLEIDYIITDRPDYNFQEIS